MKANIRYILPSLMVAGFAFVLVLHSVAAPTVIITPPAPPTIVVNPPPPVAVVVVPDYYVWDGYEYVGVVGDQYYYLGPGDVWVVCDPPRLERFHAWERGHPDWRSHATHNVKYRNVDHAHAQPQPTHDDRHAQPQPTHEDQHVQPAHNPSPAPPAHDEQREHQGHDHNGPPQ